MFHYFICCKLTFDLQGNNKLHILNIHYYKLIIKKFLKFYFEVKLFYLYALKKIASYITIHLHKFTYNLMFNENLSQFKTNIQISCV
jgi:hypothetical protein